MKKIDAKATVYFNQDYFELCTMSQGMLAYAEPSASPHYLPPDVDDATLGRTLRIALAASKRVSVEEFQKIFQSGVVQQLGKDRDAWAMKQYGYKTKRAMYRKMNCCWISVSDGQIEVAPAHHKTIDGYTANKTDGPFPLYVAETVSDAELGAALREGFMRCTSAIA